MFSDINTVIRTLSVAAVPALLGIILHEVAHGWMANRCGDSTAKMLGRLTINPLPHIDPMGLLCFVLTSLSGSFIFGWAKPVPVNPNNFYRPARDMMLVSLAGPCTNFLLAIAFAVLLRLQLFIFPYQEFIGNATYAFMLLMFQTGVMINFGLGWLNLLPVPPLDGSKVLAYFLPAHVAYRYMGLERYGFIILLLLLFTGALGFVLGPLVRTSAELTLTLLGL